MQQPGKRRQIASSESKIIQIFCRIIKLTKLYLSSAEDTDTSPVLSAGVPGVRPDTGRVRHHLAIGNICQALVLNPKTKIQATVAATKVTWL